MSVNAYLILDERMCEMLLLGIYACLKLLVSVMDSYHHTAEDQLVSTWGSNNTTTNQYVMMVFLTKRINSI